MELVEEFRNWLVTDGKMAKTLESYTGDVAGFLDWLHEKDIEAEKFSRKDLIEYKNYLLGSGYAVNTINKKVNSLRSFNEYLINEGVVEEMVVRPKADRVKIAQGSGSSIDTFSAEEIKIILRHTKNETVSKRDKIVVHLLLYTGIRVSELVNIRLDNLDLLAGELKVVGKGGKYREIPLNQKVKKAIREYIQTERKKSKYSDSDYLIITERSPKAHRDTINYLLNKMGEELNLEIYPHKFRHTTFTMLIKKGVDIATVSELAGHSTIETTHKYYLNTSKEEKAEAVALL